MEAKILPTTKAKTLPVRTSKSNFRPPHRHPGCGQPPNQEPVQRWRGRKATVQLIMTDRLDSCELYAYP
eukprot:1141007-Pelagomonas_calceolata.AAC.3